MVVETVTLVIRRVSSPSILAHLRQKLAFLSPPTPLSYPLLMAVACLGAIRLQAERETITPFHIAWYNDEKSSHRRGWCVYPDLVFEAVGRRQRIRPLDELNCRWRGWQRFSRRR
jgi:hypothetical protein